MAKRHEEKYLLDLSQYSVLKARVQAVLKPDKYYENGTYTVSSLYFDDESLSAYHDKEEGIGVHVKYRIRTYNQSSSRIILECKTKEGQITEKKSAVISKKECMKLSSGKIVINPDDSDVLKTLKAEMLQNQLKPSTVVKYKREAYVYEPLGVRITFDSMIESLPATPYCLVMEGAIALPALPRNTVIMEVKYNDRLPAMIKRLCTSNAQKISVSKYALCKLAKY